jgi:phosphoribosylaminoimidazole-succinocarboxamide synthase
MTRKAWILCHIKDYLYFKLITLKIIKNHIVGDVEVRLFWIIQFNTNDVLLY